MAIKCRAGSIIRWLKDRAETPLGVTKQSPALMGYQTTEIASSLRVRTDQNSSDEGGSCFPYISGSGPFLAMTEYVGVPE